MKAFTKILALASMVAAATAATIENRQTANFILSITSDNASFNGEYVGLDGDSIILNGIGAGTIAVTLSPGLDGEGEFFASVYGTNNLLGLHAYTGAVYGTAVGTNGPPNDDWGLAKWAITNGLLVPFNVVGQWVAYVQPSNIYLDFVIDNQIPDAAIPVNVLLTNF